MTDIKAQLEERLGSIDACKYWWHDKIGVEQTKLIQATLSAVLKHEDGWREFDGSPIKENRIIVKDMQGRIFKAYWNVAAQCWKYSNQTGFGIKLVAITHWKPIDQPSLLERIKEEMG